MAAVYLTTGTPPVVRAAFFPGGGRGWEVVLDGIRMVLSEKPEFIERGYRTDVSDDWIDIVDGANDYADHLFRQVREKVAREGFPMPPSMVGPQTMENDPVYGRTTFVWKWWTAEVEDS